jgi:hypothetical protein
MYFLSGTAIMNVAAGFSGGFSFFYTTTVPATVRVYDGLNATGNVLATINLAANTPANNCQSGSVIFCNWSPGGQSFNGIARSIDFGGTVNQVGYDNITVGSGTPVGQTPVPTVAANVPTLNEWALIALAMLAAIAGAIALRRRSA